MNKILFTVKVHSSVDLITNSSSELFVGKKDDSIKDFREIIKSIYPDYLEEYQEVKTIEDSSKPILELDYPEFYDVDIFETHNGSNCPYCYIYNQIIIL